MSNSPPTRSETRRIAALAIAAGLSPSKLLIQRAGRRVFRVRDGPQDLAIKLFDGRGGLERARLEAAAYLRLHPLGAPVPRLRAFDVGAQGIARYWVVGASLADMLRAGATPVPGLAIASAWLRLVDALAPWTDAVSARRMARARRSRAAELDALAVSVAGAPLLVELSADAAAVAPRILELAPLIAAAPLAVVPLDASPGNVIMTPGGKVVFVDLEAIGLDYPAFALCKAALLGHAATEDGAARSALVGLGAEEARAPLAWAPSWWEGLDAAHLLLALADACRADPVFASQGALDRSAGVSLASDGQPVGTAALRAVRLAVARVALSAAEPMAAIRATLC